MKFIKLTQGKLTVVDDEDFEWLNQWKWHVSNYGYAVRRTLKRLGRKLVFMHRVVNQTLDNMDTDHINRNRLDNRKNNLKTVTKMQNTRNRDLNKNNTSGHNGISWDKRKNKWEVQIYNIKKIRLGYFEDINEAITARRRGEEVYWA